MAHIHDVTDQDTHFLVDTETRKISNETNTKVTLVQFDHNSEVLTFEMPRMVEGHDMAECDEIRVHYINISKNRKKQKEGVYEVQDKRVSEDKQNVRFSWLISRNATGIAGSLNFLICFSCISEQIDFAWNTEICKSISVSDGIDNSEAIEEEYLDILEQWKRSIPEWAKENNPDKSLKLEGRAADSKAVGDALYKKADKEVVKEVLNILKPSEDNEGKFLKIENGKTIWSKFGITPPNCTNVSGVYNRLSKRNELRFKEPDDIVVNGVDLCAVSCVKIVKNNSHIPANPYDGTIVDTIYKENFNKHVYSFYVDETTVPEGGETWYYKIFPFSSEGVYNSDDSNAVTIEIKLYTVYGFTIDPNESDPFSNITYIEENTNFAPAHMDYTTGKFDYGDWANAWFIADLKPCRLNSDGSVAYDLNPNDYSLKADGTASDIADSNVDGNIMVGIPKVYYKMTQNDDGTISYRFSDAKIDEEYKCYAHMDANGNEIPYSYQPAYNGSLINNKLRSLSGQSIMYEKNATMEIAYATANNLEGSNIWYTEVLADRMLINLLLMLIGKSTHTQTTFGNGHYTRGSNQSHLLASGTMDDKGLFWGTNGTGSGVKVFGIENYWGNQWRRIGGYICDSGVQKIKLTYGTQDGSLSTGYTATGNGYIVIEDSTPTGSSSGYLNEMIFTKYGLVPKKSSGSANTYFCDGMWYNNSICSYALVGGYCYGGFQVGAFAVVLDNVASYADWHFGAALSCKPLATV